MRLIRFILISIVLLFGLWTLISLMIPSHVVISRATNIAAAPSAIFGRINDSSQWNRWHPWFAQRTEENARVRFLWQQRTDTQSTVVLTYPGARNLHNTWKLHSYPGADSATLQWRIDFHLRWYPWEKFSSLLFESNYGGVMQQGLETLKKDIESDGK
ncbi:SRPBCC family protein [Flaviaesturariibacter amylovorans]|uniref:SRPBCC family protein n=1 Tax=Flaviaesturariibacter amylovorans TaxID=1084520 RepID=UPI0031EDCD24